MVTVDEHRLAATAERPLENVILAASATRERFIVQDRALVHDEVPLRQEEPLALAGVGRVPATEPIARPYLGHRLADLVRLQRALGRVDAGDTASRLGNRGDEPVPLVEAA